MGIKTRLTVVAMAPRTDAAARSFILLNVWFCVCEVTRVSGLRLAYACAELMNIGFACQIDITPDFFVYLVFW